MASYRAVPDGEEPVLHRAPPLLPHPPQSGTTTITEMDMTVKNRVIATRPYRRVQPSQTDTPV